MNERLRQAAIIDSAELAGASSGLAAEKAEELAG